MHLDVYKLTNVPKLRSFQYRLSQRALVTNVNLYKWKISPTELCSFCCKKEETVIHLLVECEIVRQLWEQVSEYIRDTYHPTSLSITTYGIIFNRIVPGKSSIINFLCLITKQYIYRSEMFEEGYPFFGISRPNLDI